MRRWGLLLILLLAIQASAHLVPFGLWRAQNLFIWMGGPNVQSQSGRYGTQGVGSTANTPGLRFGAVTTWDSSGNLWLFGGNGYDGNGNNDNLNDLWKYNPTNGQWTWVSGSIEWNHAGNYGSKGTGNTDNFPGARYSSAMWYDSSGGNIWIFGGAGPDSTGNWGYLNDLWKYNVSSGQWTWMTGNTLGNKKGTYGTKWTAAANNTPPGRNEMVYWNDGSGNLWLFGGYGSDSSTSNQGVNNDLWKYNISLGQWTWMAGSTTNGATGVYGTQGVGATTNTPGGRQATTGWVDASGNLWLWGGYGTDGTSIGVMNDLWKFTPGSKTWTWNGGATALWPASTFGTNGVGSTTNTPGGRGWAASAIDSSGNAWIFGGYGPQISGADTNYSDLWKYTASDGKWTWVSGQNTPNNLGTYGTLGVSSTANAPGGRAMTTLRIDSSANLWLFGGIGWDSQGPFSAHKLHTAKMNDLWQYSTSSGQWTWKSGSYADLQQGLYGAVGASSTSYLPSARTESMGWVDASGNLYLFGGWGVDTIESNPTPLGDLWKYSPTAKTWTLLNDRVARIDNATAAGNYGTKGTGSTANYPGIRSGGMTWTDSSGNLWLFGGAGFDSTGAYGGLSDLWKYAPGSGPWTWVGGPNTMDTGGTWGTKGTGSTANIPAARGGSVTWTDASGNFYLFGGYGKDSSTGYDLLNDLWKYNPSNGQWTWLSGSNLVLVQGTYGTKGTAAAGNIPGARTTAKGWLDQAGNLWLFGGVGVDGSNNYGSLNDLWKYNPGTNQWTWMSGSTTNSAWGTYGTQGVANAANVPGARLEAASWRDLSGNFWLMGGQYFDSIGGEWWGNDVWKYDVGTGLWTWMGGSNVGGSNNGVYNSLGAASPNSVPGSRHYPLVWNATDGTAWIFGGGGLDASGNTGYLNDFWKFSPMGSP